MQTENKAAKLCALEIPRQKESCSILISVQQQHESTICKRMSAETFRTKWF